MRDFENRDVARIVGLNRRTLIDWTERGLVKPSVQKADGAGTRRRYSEEDLVALAIVKTLLADGIKREMVKAIALSFADSLEDRPLAINAEREAMQGLYLLVNLENRSASWLTIPHPEGGVMVGLRAQLSAHQAKLGEIGLRGINKFADQVKIIRALEEASMLTSQYFNLTELGERILTMGRAYVLNVTTLKEDIRRKIEE